MSAALVVSVHDVCPRTQADCAVILAELDRLGIRRRSLLVIPAEPGAELDLPCARWLRDLAARGDEIVQHGLYHRRQPGEPPLSAPRALLDALLARGAGEFLGLDHAAATARLAEGRQRLGALGLSAAGFVAPAWLYSGAAAEAVRDSGFRYLTTHLRLRDFTRGADTWSFGISNRPGPLRDDLIGRGVNELMVAAHRAAPLLRIAIHPADLHHGRPFEHTLSLLARLVAAGRQPMTYLDWCDRGQP
ncbi:MAG: polysaccharide deacetylase family protein [Armatimonadetes bacterium]|nr:polysaccharide deacetylase family protein [Armatimonadota bacterium]